LLQLNNLNDLIGMKNLNDQLIIIN